MALSFFCQIGLTHFCLYKDTTIKGQTVQNKMLTGYPFEIHFQVDATNIARTVKVHKNIVNNRKQPFCSWRFVHGFFLN